MTIRSRLTVWYASVFLASIFLMAGVMYYELVYERRANNAAGLPKEPVEQEMAEVIFFYGCPTALVTVLGGWLMLRKLLAPLKELTNAAEHIRANNLTEPLPRTGNGDEVDRLSEVLNASNRRLSDWFDRIHEFTLHASHELKTPLAVMRSELEMALREQDLSATQHERILSQLDEVERLSKIVDGLTLLTKADAGQMPLNDELIHFDELVSDAFDDAKILGQASGLQVEMLACDPARVRGDRHRLRQLLLNLVDNAVNYNEPGGRVTMGVTSAQSEARFFIANTGPGIPEAKLSRVFDRFFRGDPSHSRTGESCGLGLSIARWIVSAHGGTISIESPPAPELTRITVCLPLAKDR